MKFASHRGLHNIFVMLLFLSYRRFIRSVQADESAFHNNLPPIDLLRQEEFHHEHNTRSIHDPKPKNNSHLRPPLWPELPVHKTNRHESQINDHSTSQAYGSQTQSTNQLISLILKSSSFLSPQYGTPITRVLYSELNHSNYWPFNMERVRLPPGYQSPINIHTEKIEEIDMPPLDTHSYEELDDQAELICFNTGQTIECKVKNGTIPPYIQGGPLPSRYIFDNMHWHWGKGAIGSEHLINGQPYAAEVHVVHYKEKYGSFEKAKKKQDGLAIFALFGRITQDDNSDLKTHFNDILQHMLLPTRTRPSKWFDVFQFIHKIVLNNQRWMTYPGSLTSVPYKESVTWLVYFECFNISMNQLDVLRSTLTIDGHKHTVHRRPVHDLRGDNRPLLVKIRSPLGEPSILA